MQRNHNKIGNHLIDAKGSGNCLLVIIGAIAELGALIDAVGRKNG